MRVTDVLRTIADNAAIETDRGIRAMARHAQREHGVTLDELVAYAAARPPQSYRHARIRRALALYITQSARTDSEREVLVMELCAGNGIPLPETQKWIAGFRVDFFWPAARLILELDDRWSHDNPIRFVEDRARDRQLHALGYVVVRFAVQELLRHPARVARELAALYTRLAA